MRVLAIVVEYVYFKLKKRKRLNMKCFKVKKIKEKGGSCLSRIYCLGRQDIIYIYLCAIIFKITQFTIGTYTIISDEIATSVN